MRQTITWAPCLLLLLSACSESPESSKAIPADRPAQNHPAPVVVSEPNTPPEKTLTEQAADLGQAAWEKTKETAGETSETVKQKSIEVYESTKQKTGEIAETVVEKSQEYYEVAKDKSKEAYETAADTASEFTDQAKEKTTELYQSTKAKAKETF